MRRARDVGPSKFSVVANPNLEPAPNSCVSSRPNPPTAPTPHRGGVQSSDFCVDSGKNFAESHQMTENGPIPNGCSPLSVGFRVDDTATRQPKKGTRQRESLGTIRATSRATSVRPPRYVRRDTNQLSQRGTENTDDQTNYCGHFRRIHVRRNRRRCAASRRRQRDGYESDGGSWRVSRPFINNESVFVQTSGTWAIIGPNTKCVISGGPGARCKANAPGSYTITHLPTGSQWVIYIWVASPGTGTGPSGKPATPHPEPWQEIPSRPPGIWV